MLLFFVLLSLTFSLSSSDHPFCKRNQWGTYCTDDLTGYRKCTGWSWVQKNRYQLVKEEKCPPRTRCSCFLGNDCSGFIKRNESEICQPYKQSFPIREVVHVRYRRNGWRQTDAWKSEREKFSYRGEIKQNIWKKSRLEIWIENDKRYFELIKPRNGTGFVKYTGVYPRTCEKTIEPLFTAFGAEILYYTHAHTLKIEKRYERQRWHNNIYHRAGLGLERKWTVIADKKKRRLYPVTYETSYTASQEDPCCDFFESVRYYRMPVKQIRNWFETPSFCP